jgi:hypothetical protein
LKAGDSPGSWIAVAFKLLQPTPFQDADRVATLPAFARVHGLRTMSDLNKLGSFTYGGPPENQTRYQGIVEMRQAHGLDNVFVPYPVGDQYQPLNRHRVDTIAIFTTDGQLLARHYAIQRPAFRRIGAASGTFLLPLGITHFGIGPSVLVGAPCARLAICDLHLGA